MNATEILDWLELHVKLAQMNSMAYKELMKVVDYLVLNEDMRRLLDERRRVWNVIKR